ncbi:MAG: E2/UBC family protein [Polyangiaceae bacterium]|nr:E2/UBC family protein [Polyangiaceae bacterium]
MTLLVAQALDEAAQACAEFGFTRTGERSWTGSFPLGGTIVPATLELPKRFPAALPIVRVTRDALPRRVPHVGRDGKICLAPSGVRLDIERPGEIVRAAVERSKRVLADGLTDSADVELQREFQAYWPRQGGDVGSICNAAGPSREVIWRTLESRARFGTLEAVVADDPRQFREWAGRVGVRGVHCERALFVRLEQALPAPEFDDPMRVGEFIRKIRCRAPDASVFNSYLVKAQAKSLNVLLSMPDTSGESRIVVGLEFPLRPIPAMRRRPSQLIARVLQGHGPARGFAVRRLDADFLLARVGLPTDLAKKTVTLVGCGAVGSACAFQLLASGVGRVRLIDPELLEEANVHRHAAGIRFVGRSKVEALQLMLGEHFPHAIVEPIREPIESVLERTPEAITGSDLIIIAVGDETLELDLTKALPRDLPRVHVWLEAYGLGGHVLEVPAPKAHGCYYCLFGRSHDDVFTNEALFAADRQVFDKSLAGCAGTFTPYGAADATRAACEAQRAALRVLAGNSSNTLTSWMEDLEDFLGRGFKVSARASGFKPGERQSTTRFARPGCPGCKDERA